MLSTHLRRNLVLVFALVAIGLILFLPSGFNVGFYLDGWSFYDKLNTAGQIGAAIPAPASRPSLNVAWVIAYAIDSNSYVGANLVLTALLIGKGLLCAAVLHKLTKNRALSLGFGTLAMLLPADTGVFYLGALTLHLALFCWLAATYATLTFYETRRASAALVVVLMLVIACGAYEIVFLFIPVGLLAIWTIARKWNGRFMLAAVIYGLVPAVMAIRYALLWFSSSEGVQYQSNLLDRSVGIGDMIGSLGRSYVHHFIGGWWADGAPLTFLPYALASALIVGGALWWLTASFPAATAPVSQDKPVTSKMGISMEMLVAVGVLMIALGVALYLPTSERDSTLRTGYFSSLGAALAISAAYWWLAVRLKHPDGRRIAFALLIAGLTVVGSARLIAQRALFRDRSLAQQAVLQQIVTLIPRFDAPASMLFIDTEEESSLTSIFSGTLYLRGALSLVYDSHQLAVGICPPGEPDPAAYNYCQFDEGIATQFFDGFPYVQTTYDRLIVLRYNEGQVELVEALELIGVTPDNRPYAPHDLIDEDAPLPPRAATMLTGMSDSAGN